MNCRSHSKYQMGLVVLNSNSLGITIGTIAIISVSQNVYEEWTIPSLTTLLQMWWWEIVWKIASSGWLLPTIALPVFRESLPILFRLYKTVPLKHIACDAQYHFLVYNNEQNCWGIIIRFGEHRPKWPVSVMWTNEVQDFNTRSTKNVWN